MTALPVIIAPGDPGHIGHHQTVHALLNPVDAPFVVAPVRAGLLAARPAAGQAGRLDVTTDTKRAVIDTGVAWQPLDQVRGVENVVDQGADVSGVANASSDFTDANAALPAVGGRTLAPAGAYRLVTGLAVGPSEGLIGVGSRASTLTYEGTGVAVSLGNPTFAGAALAYGCSIADLSIVMSDSAATAMTLRETSGGLVSNLYIEGVVSGANVGVDIDGGDTSSLFTLVQGVIANHVKIGYRMRTSDAAGIGPTSAMFLSASAFGDNVAGSVGFQFKAAVPGQSGGAGNGSVIIGGNSESVAIGIEVESSATGPAGLISVVAHRFEGTGNAMEVGLYSQGLAVIGCQGVDAIVTTDGYRYDGYCIFGNFDPDGRPIENIISGRSIFRAWDDDDVPLIAKGVSAQAGHLIDARSALDANLFSVDNIGRIAAIEGRLVTINAANGTPEGARTAIVGSLYLRTDGGVGTTLYVKSTGSGNTGWVALT